MVVFLKLLFFAIAVLFLSCNEDKNSLDLIGTNTHEIIPDSISKLSAKSKAAKVCKGVENDFTDSKIDTIYTFSNGKKIALSGYRNTESDSVNFSEFVLFVCGESKIIDFWGATETCNLKVIKDTLFVEGLINLPTGKDRNFESTVWGIDKLFFISGKLVQKYSLNKRIRKYSKQEVLTTLEEYENADDMLNDKKMSLVNRLFMAAISKDKQASDYFYQFKNKYELDGAFSEEYNDLKCMLKSWEDVNH